MPSDQFRERGWCLDQTDCAPPTNSGTEVSALRGLHRLLNDAPLQYEVTAEQAGRLA